MSGLLVLWMGGKVAVYIIVLSLITAASIWIGPETFTTDLQAEDGAYSRLREMLASTLA